jgi:hypothetical protein
LTVFYFFFEKYRLGLLFDNAIILPHWSRQKRVRRRLGPYKGVVVAVVILCRASLDTRRMTRSAFRIATRKKKNRNTRARARNILYYYPSRIIIVVVVVYARPWKSRREQKPQPSGTGVRSRRSARSSAPCEHVRRLCKRVFVRSALGQHGGVGAQKNDLCAHRSSRTIYVRVYRYTLAA